MIKLFIFIAGIIYGSFAIADDISTKQIVDQQDAQEQCVKLHLDECIDKCKENSDDNCVSLCKENIDNECKDAGE